MTTTLCVLGLPEASRSKVELSTLPVGLRVGRWACLFLMHGPWESSLSCRHLLVTKGLILDFSWLELRLKREIKVQHDSVYYLRLWCSVVHTCFDWKLLTPNPQQSFSSCSYPCPFFCSPASSCPIFSLLVFCKTPWTHHYYFSYASS